MTPGFWSGKKVFLTGHTGFKGGWLTLWLDRLGAQVHGYSLEPPTTPSLFETANVGSILAGHTIGDVRDPATLQQRMSDFAPDIVFHLAAQPLVRHSYSDPVATYATNVMGTVHLLEAVRHCPSVRAVVNVTTDKCYLNREWHWGYREDEALGGHDPYSSSKAAAEIVTAAMRASFLNDQRIAVASARAGNVIGGGDWASDRLVPDFFRAIDSGDVMVVRYPSSTRPWQHVLEPVSGYIQLAENLMDGPEFASAWNFGPEDRDAQPVQILLDHLVACFPSARWSASGEPQPHEAKFLKLDSSRARALLGWRPRWSLAQALEKTAEWHQAWRSGQDMHAVTLDQIASYEAA